MNLPWYAPRRLQSYFARLRGWRLDQWSRRNSKPFERIPKPKMTAAETIEWLRQRSEEAERDRRS